MSTTCTVTEPNNGATVVIRDVDNDFIPVTRNDNHHTAANASRRFDITFPTAGRWFDLTFPTDEREPLHWDELQVVEVLDLGDPIDPATTPEPDDATHIVVKRINTGTGDTNWYTLIRKDSDVPSLADYREENGLVPLEEISDPQEREEQRIEEEHAMQTRWFLEQCYAEGDLDWGDIYGRFIWAQIGQGAATINITVYPVTPRA